MIDTRTGRALEAMGRPLRRWSGALWLGAALLAGMVAFAVAAWVVRSGVERASMPVLGAWTFWALAAVTCAWLGGRERRSFSARALATALERDGAARHGALMSMLDPQATGTSTGLAAAADARALGRLVSGGSGVVDEMARRLRRRGVYVGAGLVLAGGALAGAAPWRAPSARSWSPAAAWALWRAPVTLIAEPGLVDRGRAVTLRLSAPGHRQALLWSRIRGQAWSPSPVALDSAGLATQVIADVQSDLYFRLSAGRKSSDTLTVGVRLPAFLGTLRVTARYPAYLGLEAEPVPMVGDTVPIPAGTTLDVEGEASTALAVATWSTPAGPVPLGIQGRRFSGRLVPGTSGDFVLRLTGADGAPMAGDPVQLSIRVVEDRQPVVSVPVPGGNTVASVDLQLPLVLDARDDHGLTRLELVSRTSRVLAPVRTAVPLPDSDGQDRALVEAALDLRARGLQPGDTVWYRAEVTDNSPARQAGRSPEFALVIPTEADQRAARREAAGQVAGRLDSLVAASRRLERQAGDLAASRQRVGEQGRPDPSLGYEEARRSEAVARNQEGLLREAEQLRETLEALKEAAGRGEAPDTALVRRLGEVSEQLRRALSPELREKLAALQRSLRTLDPESAREALRQLAEAQHTLREALERSRDLFKRAALEGELGTLAEDARALAEEQQEWNRQLSRADSSQAAAAEAALAERADSVASGLARVAEQMELAGARDRLDSAATGARRASGQMRQAGTAARQGQRAQARASGESAGAEMEEVGQEAAEQRARQQEAWRREVVDALDRAMAETARLGRQQLGVLASFDRGAGNSMRGEQALVEESAQKLVDQVLAVSGRNALVSPQIAVALAVARREMSLAREAVSTASSSTREAAEHAAEAVDALNVAAFRMVRARQDVAGASSGSGVAEAMERMTRLAQRQGQLSQQTGGLLPLMGSLALQAQLQALAEQQRALAQAMERLRAQGQVPGTRELSEEARELAGKLAAGQLDRETVARQEQLFRRMLDAGRTLEGEEQDEKKERQSTTARDGEVHLPPALRQRLDRDGAVRVPGWDELQRLSPEERRLVSEYFRRLSAGGTR